MKKSIKEHSIIGFQKQISHINFRVGPHQKDKCMSKSPTKEVFFLRNSIGTTVLFGLAYDTQQTRRSLRAWSISRAFMSTAEFSIDWPASVRLIFEHQISVKFFLNQDQTPIRMWEYSLPIRSSISKYWSIASQLALPSIRSKIPIRNANLIQIKMVLTRNAMVSVLFHLITNIIGHPIYLHKNLVHFESALIMWSQFITTTSILPVTQNRDTCKNWVWYQVDTISC